MKKKSTIPSFPYGDDIYETADWVELAVLRGGRPFKRGNLVTTIAREDANLSAADVMDELQRRSRLMGKLWPLQLDGSENIVSLRSRPPARVLYTFFAALGLRQGITNHGRELFESCVSELSAGLTANHGIRIGAPRRNPVPTSLADAISMYCAASVEFDGKMRAPPLSDGDLGMDIANWMPFRDGRGGYLHFIGQCATGADWSDKLTELNPHKWADHVNWAVPPVRFFATPFVIPTENFRRSCLDGGVVLDRPRLVELATKTRLTAAMLRAIDKYTASLYV
jgi:hypothetical protein